MVVIVNAIEVQMRHWIPVLILFITFFSLSGACAADADKEITVVAEGTALVTNDVLLRAEDEALSAAKRAAVEQAVGVFVKAETTGENHDILRESVYTKSEGYITSWSKMANSLSVRSLDGNKVLSEKIQAKVSLIRLLDDLSNIEEVYNAMDRPKVLVVIKEDGPGSSVNPHPAESAVIGEFLARKFDVVDAAKIDGINRICANKGPLSAANIKALTEIALREGAEILVVGYARSTECAMPDGIDKSLNSCRARLDARIMFTTTGEVLFTPNPTSGKGICFGTAEEAGTKALENAGKALISGDASKFTSQVYARWALEVQNGRIFRITAEHGTYKDLSALISAVKQYRGYVSIVRDRFDAATGACVLDVKMRIQSSELRAKLQESVILGKKITVQNAFGTRTDIKFIVPSRKP